jgi:hypothetical protein
MDVNSNPKHSGSPFRHLGRKFWIIFLAASAFVFLADALLDHLVRAGELPDVTQSVFNLSGFYQRIVTAPRNPVARYVEVIEIDPATDPAAVGLTDICDQREMMTRLLSSIASALPRVIVLDKYYGVRVQKPCTADAKLIQTVQNLRANKIPVVLGRRVSENAVSKGSEKRYYLMPSMAFEDQDPCTENPDARSKNCLEGVVNIDPDTRKLPLQWMLFTGNEEAQNGSGQFWHDTLSLCAARAYDDNLLGHHPELAGYIGAKQHPYISFLKPSEFDHYSVSQILASSPRSEGSGVVGSSAGLSSPLRNLTGKIVLIGEINQDMDSHASVVGRLPGIYMQANYMEALLDDRYFKPMPILDYVSGFLILFGLEFILARYSGSWVKAVLLILALCLASVGVLYLMAALLRWYVNPVAVGATAVLIKLFQPLLDRAEHAVKA